MGTAFLTNNNFFPALEASAANDYLHILIQERKPRSSSHFLDSVHNFQRNFADREGTVR